MTNSSVFLKTERAEFSISSAGTVTKCETGVETFPAVWVNRDGYSAIRVWADGKRLTFYVHVLVAKAFIPNPLGLPEVNHVDGTKKSDCSTDNLEWATGRQNSAHAHRTGLHGSKSSRFYGVTWKKAQPGKGRSKWAAQVELEGKNRHLGRYDDELDAARAVNDFITLHNLDVPLNDLGDQGNLLASAGLVAMASTRGFRGGERRYERQALA